jgi:hypothetical protein
MRVNNASVTVSKMSTGESQPLQVSPDPEILKELRSKVGKENVWMSKTGGVTGYSACRGINSVGDCERVVCGAACMLIAPFNRRIARSFECLDKAFLLLAESRCGKGQREA